ncbi:BLUF domain-containing protein [Aquimarina sp. U1-2]|uniref:BLUF domain-containing protein n=1 Tax=Aquimarina sp. U1-2 TaxID=2823141 RepID=UPI001AECD11C|nr:BLUF domain-containing protein [Aquimarina sp. U1-2]MBP2832452.1 BLUF domain-containing protein [Aquimarina sp. U1-2]
MLHVERNDEIEQLRQMSKYFEADFIEDFNLACLDFDNKHGKGYISTYQMFPGLTAKTYNVCLAKELKFTKKETDITPTYFIYCVEGHYLHKFTSDPAHHKIHQNQNVILSGGFNEGHEIVLPAEVHLKISIIFLSPEKLKSVNDDKAKRIELTMNNLSKYFSMNKKEKYFGEIDPSTAQYSRVLIENKRVDTLGIIITEGAILNTLASQLHHHEKFKSNKGVRMLSSHDLNKIIELGDYIKDRLEKKITINQLSSFSGLNPKKLQEGFNFLYGESVNGLIQRLRMERARQLLQSTDMSVSEVCYKIGIISRSYFSQVFQEYFGILPSIFRLNMEKQGLIFELSYHSKAAPNLKRDDLEAILTTSKEKNKKNGITGALIYFKKSFFQLVEGNKKDILDLYREIENDDRHYDVTLIYTGFKLKRTFGDWSMAYLGNSNISAGVKIDGDLSFVELEPIMKGAEDHEVFSDILWRRVLTILKLAA